MRADKHGVLDNKMARSLCRTWAHHRISSQSSVLRKAARTGQSIPHRRSSDVAAAVWLIHEDTIYPVCLSQSIMGSAMSRLSVAAGRLGMPAHSSQARRHKMATSSIFQSAFTGHPAAHGFLYGTMARGDAKHDNAVAKSCSTVLSPSPSTLLHPQRMQIGFAEPMLPHE